MSGTVCDDRIIRCDMDGGFRPGRQYGRGPSGGQMRDDRTPSYDPARGGGGALRATRPPPVTGKRGRDSGDLPATKVDEFGREIKAHASSSSSSSGGDGGSGSASAAMVEDAEPSTGRGRDDDDEEDEDGRAKRRRRGDDEE